MLKTEPVQLFEAITQFFNSMGGYVWGPLLLLLLVGTGFYLTLRLGWVQFSMLPYALKLAFSRKQDTNSPGDISCVRTGVRP